jgi:hypothetical protein
LYAGDGRWRAAGDGGGSPESRRRSLDFGLGATDWDADRFYAELGGRRTYLGGRGGGYGGHGGAHHKGAARPKVACGMPVLRLGLRELKGGMRFLTLL